jgi:orotate phosphoribosyltransferase
VEDLISTGGSSLKAVQALQAQGVEILGMVAIFTYGFPVAQKAFDEAGIKLVTLSNYNALLHVASQKNILNEKQLQSLSTWRENPGAWNV